MTSQYVFFLRRRREPALPTGRKCRLATLPGCGKQSHKGQHHGHLALVGVWRALPSSAASLHTRVVHQMAPLPRTPVTVGASSCLPGLAADLLSKAELPFWEGRRDSHLHPHTGASEEKGREKSAVSTHGLAPLPEEPKKGGESRRGGGDCYAALKWHFQLHSPSPGWTVKS